MSNSGSINKTSRCGICGGPAEYKGVSVKRRHEGAEPVPVATAYRCSRCFSGTPPQVPNGGSPYRWSQIDRAPTTLGDAITNAPPSSGGVAQLTAKTTGIRVVHVSKSSYDIYIGRAVARAGFHTGSIWANPLRLSKNATAEERRLNLLGYRDYVLSRDLLREELIRGALLCRSLGCWCKNETEDPTPPEEYFCHGDVLRDLSALLFGVKMEAKSDA